MIEASCNHRILCSSECLGRRRWHAIAGSCNLLRQSLGSGRTERLKQRAPAAGTDIEAEFDLSPISVIVCTWDRSDNRRCILTVT
jgi:hypothetical protein